MQRRRLAGCARRWLRRRRWALAVVLLQRGFHVRPHTRVSGRQRRRQKRLVLSRCRRRSRARGGLRRALRGGDVGRLLLRLQLEMQVGCAADAQAVTREGAQMLGVIVAQRAHQPPCCCLVSWQARLGPDARRATARANRCAPASRFGPPANIHGRQHCTATEAGAASCREQRPPVGGGLFFEIGRLGRSIDGFAQWPQQRLRVPEHRAFRRPVLFEQRRRLHARCGGDGPQSQGREHERS